MVRDGTEIGPLDLSMLWIYSVAKPGKHRKYQQIVVCGYVHFVIVSWASLFLEADFQRTSEKIT